MKVDRSKRPVSELTGLTQREQEVALGIARGWSRPDIARALGCSEKTVDTHRAHVLARLGLRNSVELAHLAIRRGWVPLRFESAPAAPVEAATFTDEALDELAPVVTCDDGADCATGGGDRFEGTRE